MFTMNGDLEHVSLTSWKSEGPWAGMPNRLPCKMTKFLHVARSTPLGGR